VLFFTGVIGGHRGAAAGTESQARANQSTQTSALKSTVDLEPFVVNLADPETARYLKVKMVIELNNETMKAQVDKLKPKIQDTIILLLTSKTFEQIRDGKGKQKLKQELTLRLNEILGAGAVSDVLFTEFIVS
jgi:flagellar FliL protein